MLQNIIPVISRARGRCCFAALALVLYIAAPSVAADQSADVPLALSSGPEVSLGGYFLRMVIALVLLGGIGYLAAKYLPKRFRFQHQGRLRVIGMLNLGRDVVYLLSVGPDVLAVMSNKSGSVVLGRWSREEWDDYEAIAHISDSKT